MLMPFGFMTLAFILGYMNFIWMGLITFLVILEKIPQIGKFIKKPLGILLILIAIYLIFKNLIKFKQMERPKINPTDWKIKGELILNCSCDVRSLCSFSRSTSTYRGTLSCLDGDNTDEGHYEAESLNNLNVGLLVDILVEWVRETESSSIR